MYRESSQTVLINHKRKSKHKHKKNFFEWLFDIFNVTLMSSFALICFYPFYYVFIASISSARAISRGVFLIPRELTLINYITIFNTPGIYQSIWISVSRTFISTFLVIIFSTFLAYLFTHEEIPLRKTLYRYFIVAMYVSAGFVPWFILMRNLGLWNNYLIYIIPGMLSIFFVILTKTYMESIPAGIKEAAEIDGAGILRIYFQIMLPACIPIIACLVVFQAVGVWNEWATALFFITDTRLYPLQYLLYQMVQNNMANAVRAGGAFAGATAQQQFTPTSLRLAMTFFTTLPIILVYPFMQRYSVKGIMLGAIKG